jgi:hypothetical protein
MKVFCAQSESVKNTRFIIRGINPSELDKQYIMNEIQTIGTMLLTQQLSSSPQDSEGIQKLHTTLESKGYAHANVKPVDTIVLNDQLSIKLFASPIMQHAKTHRCWYCRLSIPHEWAPIGLPTKYNEKTGQFSTEGIFCSFNCITSYVHEFGHTYRYRESGHLLYLLYRKLFQTNLALIDILPSPSWKLLKEYGGNLDVEDYRKSLQHVEYKQMNQTWFINALELFTEVMPQKEKEN